MVYAFFATRIRPQKHYLPKTFFSPKNTLQSSKAPYCRCQYGLLSPYFAALNTGSCYAIAPTRGQCAPPLRLCARRSAACAHTPTQPARIAVGNTGFHRPISLRSIRAFVALFRCAQYGLLLRYCPHSGAMRSAAPAMCSPLRRLRAYAYATRPYCRCQYGLLSPYFAALNTGQSNTIHPIHIKMII